MFKDYLSYVKDNPKGYWFKSKLYGWGWTPVTKEGWIVTFLYLFGILIFATTINEYSSTREVFFTFVFPVTFLTVTFIKIAYKKGEKPKWSWGTPKKTK